MEVNKISKKIRKLNLKEEKKKKKPDLIKAWIKSLPSAADIAATETPIITKEKTLDEKYELLDKLFDGLLFAIQFLQLSKCPQTFANVNPVVERMTDRSFTYTHLGQLQFILPEVLEIEKFFIQDDCTKPDLCLNLNFAIIRKDGNTMNEDDTFFYENLQIRKLFQTRLISFYQSHPEAFDVPSPVVSIDQYSNPDATVLQVSFGGSLGALNDSINALKHLGVDVAKRTITAEGSVIKTQAFVTRMSTGCKVEDPALLENIRVTIISNLLKCNQERAVGEHGPLKKHDGVYIATHIHVEDDGPKRSLLHIQTEDRPGLLIKVMKIISNASITIESAETDTQGFVAKEIFHVSYRGEALDDSMSQGLKSCLYYCLGK